MLAQRLTDTLKDLAPIVAVSVGRRDDKTTWRIDYASDPTKEQAQAVADAIAAFDPSTEADGAYVSGRTKTDAQARLDSDPILAAMFQATHERLAALERQAGIASLTEAEAKAVVLGKVDVAEVQLVFERVQ